MANMDVLEVYETSGDDGSSQEVQIVDSSSNSTEQERMDVEETPVTPRPSSENDSEELVRQVVSDLVSKVADMENKENNKVGEKKSDDEEDDDEVGLIRIRDFGSLREDPSSDEDDDVIALEPVPVSHTPFVKIEDVADDEVDVELDCVNVPRRKNYGGRGMNKRVSTAMMKHKLSSFKDCLTEGKKRGIEGLKVKPIEHFFEQLRLPGTNAAVVTNISKSHNYRMPTGQYNTSRPVVRPPVQKNVRPPSAQPTVNLGASRPSVVTGQQVLSSCLNPNQLVFDPKTGNLYCPTQPPAGNPNISSAFRVLPVTPDIRAALSTGPPPYPGTAQSITVTRPPVSQYANISNTSARLGVPQPVRPPIQGMVGSQVRAVPISSNTRQVTCPSNPVAPINNVLTSTAAPATLPPVSAQFRMNHRNPTPNNVPASVQSNARQQSSLTFIAPKPPATFPLNSKTRKQTMNNATVAGVATNNSTPVNIPSAGSTHFTGNKSYPNSEAGSDVTAGTQQPVAATNDRNNSKTFPSLVVQVKPCLHGKNVKQQAAASRQRLDNCVKSMLMVSPAKFCEHLMQQRLLKTDQRCPVHRIPMKLALFGKDPAKQPLSGGYAWICDYCGGEKDYSVFTGSIFEGCTYPPGTIVKLIYHWACQTPASNILQWVKVSNYYLKNFFTLLRSACIAGLHENFGKMGGPNKYIEIGVISLGSSAQNRPGSSRAQKTVKIEIMGVFDPTTRRIRLRVINPTPGLTATDSNRERWNQIITPLHHIIDKGSILLIDNSLDKVMLERVGFKNVKQNPTQTTQQFSRQPTNVNVMNYLRNIVPKMFTNTLTVLSRTLVQQFLDELSWREAWGQGSSACFDKLISQIVEMTSADLGEPLISRLNKISMNPFIEWYYGSSKTKANAPISPQTFTPSLDMLPDSITSTSSNMVYNLGLGHNGQLISQALAPNTGPNFVNVASSYMAQSNSYLQSGSRRVNGTPMVSNQPASTGTKRKTDEAALAEMKRIILTDSKTHVLQGYYYVKVPGANQTKSEFPPNMKCPLCSKAFRSNLESISHITSHVLSAGGRSSTSTILCRYCAKEFSSSHAVDSHVETVHKKLLLNHVCRICNETFTGEVNLILHMWRHHVQAEAPYACEVCGYRSSFHYDVIDHFHTEHNGWDVVMCCLCLKILTTKSVACMKHLVVHLQNHVIKKGKKCQDCVLVFSNDLEYRQHLIIDSCHDSRRLDNFIQMNFNTSDTIRMPKPPAYQRNFVIPPPTKRQKTSTPKPSTQVQTLNSAISIPINPNDKFISVATKTKISDLDKVGKLLCWECHKPLHLPGHFGRMSKCSKCRFSTDCHRSMVKHANSHTSGSKHERRIVRTTDILECDYCDFTSANADRFADHLARTGHKTCAPSEDQPPNLEPQV